MYKSKFIGSLGTLQGLLIVAKGVLLMCDIDLPWGIVLIPVWCLLLIATIFWGLCGLLVSWLRTK
jgi:hypothetical protein